jgi:hypothetical protein
MRGEMHNGIDALHDLGQPSLLSNIGHHQLETFDQEGVPARQVIVDDYLVSPAPQSARRVASDVSRSTHYQNGQFVPLYDWVVTDPRLLGVLHSGNRLCFFQKSSIQDGT